MRPSSEGARGCGCQCAHSGQHVVPDRVDRRLRFGTVTHTYLGSDAERRRHGQAIAPHHVDAVSLVAQNIRRRRRVAIQLYHGSCGHPDVQARPRSKPNPKSVPNPRRTGDSGLVASIKSFPLRSPQPCSASCVPCHGVYNTTTSASDAAASLARTVPSDACLGSSGLRTPNVTSWPRLCHAVPNERPTLPAPMIAILMVAPLRYVRLAGYLYLSRAYLMI